METVGSLFDPKHFQWGLRGDPFLWDDLKRVFLPVPLPESEATLKQMLEGAFLALTSHSIETREAFLVPRYAHGGMSSGYVDPQVWRSTLFPLLISRFAQAPRDSGEPPKR